MQREDELKKICMIERFLEMVFNSAISPATYRVLDFHVRKNHGKNITHLIWEDPKRAYDAIVAIMGGGELHARALRKVLESYLEEVLGHPINGELYEAIVKNDVEKVRQRLVELANEYMQVHLRRI